MNVHSVEQVPKLTVIAPATGQIIAEIEETRIHEVPLFYQRGRNAFEAWSSISIPDRLRYFRKLKQLMVDEMDQIARIISDDTGKVLTEAIVADIMPTLDAIDHIIRHAEKVLSRQKAKTPFL